MPNLVFDKYSCIRCGLCVTACPGSLISQETLEVYPEPIENADDYCISCGHCVSVCPVSAVSVDGITAEHCDPVEKEAILRFEHIETLVRMRRSIRRYSETQPEDRVIERLLNVVRWAPTAKNELPVKWLVVNHKEKVRELAELVLQWITKHPGMERLQEAWDRSGDPIFRGAPSLIVAYTGEGADWGPVDATIAVETLDLCVTAMRMGACWAGYFIRAAQNDPAVKHWLGLDDSETVQGALMLGYIGDENYQRVPHRPDISLRWIQ